jgi:hypothetical protein
MRAKSLLPPGPQLFTSRWGNNHVHPDPLVHGAHLPQLLHVHQPLLDHRALNEQEHCHGEEAARIAEGVHTHVSSDRDAPGEQPATQTRASIL